MPLIRTQDGRFKIRNVPGVGTKEEKTKQLQAIKASQKGQTFAEEDPRKKLVERRRLGQTPEELVDYLVTKQNDPKEEVAYKETLDFIVDDLRDMTEKERLVVLSALLEVMQTNEAWAKDVEAVVYDSVSLGRISADMLEKLDFLEDNPESRITILAEQIKEEDEQAERDQEETENSLRNWGLMSEASGQDVFSEFSDEMVDDLYESLDNKEDFLIKLEDHFPDLFVYQGDVKKAIDAYVIEKGNPDGLNEKDLKDVAEEEIEHGLRLTELIPIFDTNIPSPNFFSFEKTLIDSESLEPEKTSAVINKAQQYLVDWYNEEFPYFTLKRPVDVTFEEVDTNMTSKVPTLRIEHELSSDDDETRDGYIDAFVDEEVDPEGRIGFVNYVYDKEADALEVQAVEVMKNWRRQGVATEMYKGLMKLYPGARILNGFQTSKGKKFRKSFDKEFDVKHSETFAEVSSLASALSSRPADLSLLQELSKEDSRRGGSLRKTLNDYNSAIRSSSDSGSYHRALLREDALLSALKDAGVSKASVGKVVDAIKSGHVDTFAEGDAVSELNLDPTNKELIRRFLNEDERKGGELRIKINEMNKLKDEITALNAGQSGLVSQAGPHDGMSQAAEDYFENQDKLVKMNQKAKRMGIYLEAEMTRQGVRKPNLVVNTTVFNNDEGEVFAESKPKFKRRGKTICKETCKETKLPKPDFLKPQSFSERVFAVERHANRLLARA